MPGSSDARIDGLLERKIRPVRVELRGYRSLGEDWIPISLEKTLHVLIGRNNCGKSNVVRALRKVVTSPSANFQLDDYHNRSKKRPLEIDVVYRPKVESIVSEIGEQEADRAFRIRLVASGGGTLQCYNPGFAVGQRVVEPAMFKRVFEVPPASSIGDRESAFHKILATETLKRELGHMEIVPVFRQIISDPGSVDTNDLDRISKNFSGRGLPTVLHYWKEPKPGDERHLQLFEKVQALFQRLTGLKGAELQVYDGQKLNVKHNNRVMEIEQYGTGIHQIVMLATFASMPEIKTVAIEEPEIHLHPDLQRLFFDFLKSLDKHVVLTTHSSAMIDAAPETDLIHLRLVNGRTVARAVQTTAGVLCALSDVGARASDLLQANSVVWVEGPSDRILIAKWMQLVVGARAPVEGVDFEFAFSGGSCASHFTVERDDVPEGFIEMMKINQNSFVIIDRDRMYQDDHLKPAAERLQKEAKECAVGFHITSGREIENYVPGAVVARSYDLNVGDCEFEPGDRVEDFLQRIGRTTKERKVLRARRFAKHMTPEDVGEGLRSFILELVAFIDDANGKTETECPARCEVCGGNLPGNRVNESVGSD